MKAYETIKILNKMWKYSVNDRTSEGIVLADSHEDAIAILNKLYSSYDASAVQTFRFRTPLKNLCLKNI